MSTAQAKSVKSTTNGTGSKLSEAAHHAGGQVREFIDNNKERAAELRHTTEEKIVENPIKSVAVAALGGLVLGMLLKR